MTHIWLLAEDLIDAIDPRLNSACRAKPIPSQVLSGTPTIAASAKAGCASSFSSISRG
jgi:hypothetical protein